MQHHTEVNEIESKISSISGLATTTALTAVENKISNNSNLVKKTDPEAKISDIESKYIPTDDFNKFTKDNVANKIKSEELINKSAIAGFINNSDLDQK